MGPKEKCTDVQKLLILGQTEQHSIMVTLLVAKVVHCRFFPLWASLGLQNLYKLSLATLVLSLTISNLFLED